MMGVGEQILACLQQLLECEAAKKQVILHRKHSELAPIVAAQQKHLARLERLSMQRSQGAWSAVLAAKIEEAMTALHQISAANGLLLAELLHGVEACLELLQTDDTTYTQAEGRAAAKAMTPAVYDLRA